MQHKISLNQFNAQQETKITLIFSRLPQFKGFDPMHAEAINDSTILHKTMLNLSGGGQNKLFFINGNALTTIDNEIWNVENVILFAPTESINLNDNHISVDYAGKTISWHGELKQKSGNELIFLCE